MRRFWQTLLAVLREIFDEAPYARFLKAEGLSSSGEAYEDFLRHRNDPAHPRRCC